ncbi:transposase [Streptomyces sp. NPDC055085]
MFRTWSRCRPAPRRSTLLQRPREPRQSPKATRGFDAGKKVNGRKRHIAVDTLGLPAMITVTPADTTDRDAARELLWRLRVMQPQITQVWADSAYGGQLVNWPGSFLNMTLKTVSRPRGAKKLRRPAQALEGRTDSGLDHESPPQRPRLRTSPAALRRVPEPVSQYKPKPVTCPFCTTPITLEEFSAGEIERCPGSHARVQGDHTGTLFHTACRSGNSCLLCFELMPQGRFVVKAPHEARGKIAEVWSPPKISRRWNDAAKVHTSGGLCYAAAVASVARGFGKLVTVMECAHLFAMTGQAGVPERESKRAQPGSVSEGSQEEWVRRYQAAYAEAEMRLRGRGDGPPSVKAVHDDMEKDPKLGAPSMNDLRSKWGFPVFDGLNIKGDNIPYEIGPVTAGLDPDSRAESLIMVASGSHWTILFGYQISDHGRIKLHSYDSRSGSVAVRPFEAMNVELALRVSKMA